jgi:hypothetical protein
MPQDRTRLGGLYLIWLSDTHYYGGRAKHFKSRWRRHRTALENGTHPNPYMQNVFNKNRRFDTEILLVIPTPSEQIHAEQQWLRDNFGRPGCVNLSRRPTNNTYISPETRKKISEANKGRKHNLSDAERQRRREAVVVMQTPEVIQKMRMSLTGRPLSPEHRRTLSDRSARKGQPIHDALRAGIVAANKRRVGEVRSQEVRAKITAKMSSLVWVHKEDVSQRVPPEKMESLLSTGWSAGRAAFSQEHREQLAHAQQGQVWVCNANGEATRVLPEELPKLQATGWQRGRKYRVTQ